MDKQKKCPLKSHSDNNAISYCQKCEIYMCNKYDKDHSDLCTNHSEYIINENLCYFLSKLIINYVVLPVLLKLKVKEVANIKIAKYASLKK